MGGRKETPPTIIMPAEGAPQAFQTIVPQKSYKDMAESTLRTEKEINRLMGQRYDEVGTPEEIGARKKGVEMQAAASYLASLPKGPVDERFKETPRSFMAETKDPAYAQNPDSMFIPQIINAPDK